MNNKNDKIDSLTPRTVLVAEDNESNFLLVFTILKKEFSIIWAHDGLEVIEKFNQYHPDIILMDIKMPNMDGLTATRKIRKTDPDIPIIAVSAFAYNSDKHEAMQAGCNDYITKPLDSRLLKDTLQLYLSKNNQS